MSGRRSADMGVKPGAGEAEALLMTFVGPSSRPAPALRRPVLVCVLLLLIITVLRVIVSNPIEAVGFLYVIPISVLAAELGVRGGLFAAVGAVLLTVAWAVAQDVPFGAIGYGARIGTFLGIGILVGLQAERRLRLQDDRERLIAELQATAMRDQLTGLPNRRAWDDRLERELSRAERAQEPLSVAVVDLDGLKRINDTQGHDHGDRLLARSADAWTGVLRQSDFLARLGGDEFVVLLPGSSAADAVEIGRRLVEALPVDRCSVGVAVWDGVEAGYEMVHRADQAMYAVKAIGGGDVGLAPAPEGAPPAVALPGA